MEHGLDLYPQSKNKCKVYITFYLFYLHICKVYITFMA